MFNVVTLCCNTHVSLCVFQSCEVMATACLNRPGSAETTEKSQLILKGNFYDFVFNHLNDQLGYTNTNNDRMGSAFKMTTM